MCCNILFNSLIFFFGFEIGEEATDPCFRMGKWLLWYSVFSAFDLMAVDSLKPVVSLCWLLSLHSQRMIIMHFLLSQLLKWAFLWIQADKTYKHTKKHQKGVLHETLVTPYWILKNFFNLKLNYNVLIDLGLFLFDFWKFRVIV